MDSVTGVCVYGYDNLLLSVLPHPLTCNMYMNSTSVVYITIPTGNSAYKSQQVHNGGTV